MPASAIQIFAITGLKMMVSLVYKTSNAQKVVEGSALNTLETVMRALHDYGDGTLAGFVAGIVQFDYHHIR